VSRGAPRYAVYLTPPPAHPLWCAGNEWLGRDPTQGPPHAGPACELVREPWRYGFHATLKAPMRLADGVTENTFFAALRELARQHAAFEMPAFQVGVLDDFLALRPAVAIGAQHPLRVLADDCVQGLERWRAPVDAAELQRHLKPGLNARQRAQVAAFGYAFVFDDWRCHFTLSGGLAAVDASSAEAVRDAAVLHFTPAVRAAWTCDALSVFVEPRPGAPFELRQRVDLRAGD